MTKTEAEREMTKEWLDDIMMRKTKEIGFLTAKSVIMAGITDIADSEAVIHKGVLMIPADSVMDLLINKTNPDF